MATTATTAGARRRQQASAEAPAPADTDMLPPTADDEGADAGDLSRWEEEDKIRDIISNEENQGATLEIYRKNLVSGRWDYVDMLGLGEWTAEARHNIARSYGGGDYKARVRKAGGVFGASFQFSIDKAVKAAPAERPSEMLELVKLQQTQQGRGGDMLPVVLQLMQQSQQQAAAQNAQMMQMVVAALSRPPAPGPSDALMQTLLAKSLAPAPALDLGKIVGVLKDLQELSGRRGGGRDQASGGSSAPRDDGFWSAILAQLPSLLGVIMQSGAGAALTQTPAPVSPLPPPPSAPIPVAAPVENPPGSMVTVPPAAAPVTVPPEPTPEQSKADANRDALRALVESLSAQAMAGTDPLTAAVALAAQLDDENFMALAVVLQRPDWLAILADAHAGAMMQSPWLLQWRERFLAELDEDPA